MKFRALPVNDLTDVTLDLEQLQTRDILDQSSLTILQLAVTGTKRKVAFGSVTVSWTASTISAAATVTHGLGTTPQVAFAQCHDTGNTGIAPPAQIEAAGSTTFAVQAVSQVSGTFSIPYYWLAIG